MKGIVIGIMMFSILINLSVAIMIDVVPAFEGMDERLGLSVEDKNEYIDNTVLDEFGNTIDGRTAEDSNNVNSDTLMDRVGLGSVVKLLSIINKYMFGFLEVIKAVFHPLGVNPYVFDAFKFVIGILYIFAAIELFTGKRLDPNE